MITHNICVHREIRKNMYIFLEKATYLRIRLNLYIFHIDVLTLRNCSGLFMLRSTRSV